MDAGVADPVVELREQFDRTRGRLFELVEATGMPVKQEDAFKRLIRRLTYDAQASVEAALKEAMRGAS